MLKNVQQELNRFAKYVVSQSRANLTRGKKNVSKSLYNSIDSNVKENKNSFSMEFLMDDYGVFQDKGVSGTEKKYNTPFKYGNLIARSIQKKGIKPSLFFTKPFNKAFNNLSKDLVEAFKLDVETLMKNSINNK